MNLVDMSKILFRKTKRKRTAYQCFYPVVVMSIIGGMCNIKGQKGSYVISYSLSVFQVVVILLNTISLILVPQTIIYMEKIDQANVLEINQTKYKINISDLATKMVNPLLVSADALILRILNLVYLQKYVISIFQKIEKANGFLNFSNIIKKDYNYMKIITGFTVLLSVPYPLYCFCTQLLNDKSYLFGITFGINHYNNFSALCVEMQFCYLAYVLKNRFQIINTCLRKMNNTEDSTASIDSDEMVFTKSKQVVNKSMKEILRISNCHKEICESSIKLNKLYSSQLLVTLTSCSLNVLLNFYFAIYGGFWSHHSTSVKPIILEALWGIFYFLRFIIVCISAENLSQQADLTKIRICKILKECTDKGLKDELLLFHLYATTNVVKFTASGFFTIDLSLISSAISAGTTYLVILANFHRDNSLNKNDSN